MHSIAISWQEYSSLKPDSLLAKYFRKNERFGRVSYSYGSLQEDNPTVIPNEIWVAFAVLFANKYIISTPDLGAITVWKAPTDDRIRELESKKIDVKFW